MYITIRLIDLNSRGNFRIIIIWKGANIMIFFKQKQKHYKDGKHSQVSQINNHDNDAITSILLQQNLELTMIMSDIMTSIKKIVAPITKGDTMTIENAEHILSVLTKAQFINLENINQLKELNKIFTMNESELCTYVDELSSDVEKLVSDLLE